MLHCQGSPLNGTKLFRPITCLMSRLTGPGVLDLLRRTHFPRRYRVEAQEYINTLESFSSTGRGIELRFLAKAQQLCNQALAYYQTRIDDLSDEDSSMTDKQEGLGGTVEEAIEQVNCSCKLFL